MPALAWAWEMFGDTYTIYVGSGGLVQLPTKSVQIPSCLIYHFIEIIQPLSFTTFKEVEK